ncbi:MAG TPA: hypothetical protein VM345_20385 [Acidimicrobiales bacterium]|nr:hypothetical protein [Acidimicrobiales bacterium]
MRFQRLLLESAGATVTVDLHPRLTVVAGVGELERASLVNELLGGLAGSRPGTHLEVVDDSGRRLGVMHPSNGGRDRVVELTTQQDVTIEFVDDNGEVNLLSPMGLDLAAARKRCRMTGGDMAALAKVDGAISSLAAHDQDRLWATAQRVRETSDALRVEVAAVGVDPEDAPLVEEIERRHHAFEAAQARLEYIRHHGIFIGGASVVGAMPAVALRHWVSIPLLAVAIITTIVSIAYRRRMDKARKAEKRALDEAGAESYLAFRLQRMNQTLDGGADRARLARAATDHQLALDAWRAMAGEVSVDWAFDMRDRIRAAAVRIREVGAPVAATDNSMSAAEPAELAQALIERMTELRHAGPRGETLPLLLDDPLHGVAPSVKAWVLELIARSAGSPQVIYLTDDADVASWARMEAISGELSILEPAPESADAAAGVDSEIELTL